MIRVRWRYDWSGKIGGSNSDYFVAVWEKQGKIPYLDADYWDQFRKWIEENYHCRWEDNEYPPQYLIFAKDSDATRFLLEWA